MDEDNLDAPARMVAILSASITCSSAGDDDHTKVLAVSDCYYDQIRPKQLRRNAYGETVFTKED